MSEFKIEKGVPLPRAKSNSQGWPFLDMEVGDSVHFDPPFANKARAAAGSGGYAKYGRKFATRTEGNGVRIWRIK